MEIFKGLQPELVWSYFEEICKIPRPSKKEEKIAAWLMEFAKKHQLQSFHFNLNSKFMGR